MKIRTLILALLLPAATPAVTQQRPAPPVLYDSHQHLLSLDKERYPRVPDAVPAGAAPGGAPPPGASVTKGRAAPPPGAEDVLDWWKAAGVEGGAIVQKRGTYGFDNSYILDSAAAHAEMRPVVVLDAADQATPAKIRDWASSRGLAAVRFTGFKSKDGTWPWLSSPAALATWRAAGEADVGIDLMSTPPGFDAATLAEVMRLSEMFPKVRVVLDHIGWPQVQGAPGYGFDNDSYRALARHKRIFYKVTTINLDLMLENRIPADAFLRAAVGRLGADHIMWGSDMGNSTGTYAEIAARGVAATAKLSPAERRAVLHDTGKTFFASWSR